MTMNQIPLVEVTDLKVYFKGSAGILKSRDIKAVDGVSFTISKGETLGIAGESGSGKSTLARSLIGINKPTSGSIAINGTQISSFKNSALRPIRKKLQMVFQDPYDSLDPRFTIFESISEGLQIRNLAKSEIKDEIANLLQTVKLPVSLASRYPKELSGGQRQRVAIARALATKPDLIICDEAVAALDVSVRAQILNLLQDIQQESGISYLFISHDLSTLRYISKNVAIMYAGKIVEIGSSDNVLTHPQHPYTKALMSAVPNISGKRGTKIKSVGEPPDPANLPGGCAFNVRCHDVLPQCSIETPKLLLNLNDSKVACHATANNRNSDSSKGGELHV